MGRIVNDAILCTLHMHELYVAHAQMEPLESETSEGEIISADSEEKYDEKRKHEMLWKTQLRRSREQLVSAW